VQPQKANPLTPDGQPDWDRLADTLYCDHVGPARTAWADIPAETREEWRKLAKGRAYSLVSHVREVLLPAQGLGSPEDAEAAVLAHALLAVELVAVHSTPASPPPDLGAYVPPVRELPAPAWDEGRGGFVYHFDSVPSGPEVVTWPVEAGPGAYLRMKARGGGGTIITGDSMMQSAPGRPLWANVARVLGGAMAGTLAGFVGLSALVLLPQGYAGFIIVTSFIGFSATIGALVAERIGRR
jgi:hypothetical protein